MREVAVAGVGMHPWGKFPDKPLIKMLTEVVDMALKDAAMDCCCKFSFLWRHGLGIGRQRDCPDDRT